MIACYILVSGLQRHTENLPLDDNYFRQILEFVTHAISDEIVTLKKEVIVQADAMTVQAKRIKTLERKQKIQIQAIRSQAREIQNLLNLQGEKREKVQQTGMINPPGMQNFYIYLILKSTYNLLLFLTNTTKIENELKMLWKDKINTNYGLNREALDSKPTWSGIVFLIKTPIYIIQTPQSTSFISRNGDSVLVFLLQ